MLILITHLSRTHDIFLQYPGKQTRADPVNFTANEKLIQNQQETETHLTGLAEFIKKYVHELFLKYRIIRCVTILR